MELIITRSYHEQGANGELLIDGKHVCHTIELPWKDNHRRVSCIPEGHYTVRKRYSKRFGLHLWVNNVPGRDAILVHSFNNALKECLGCIGPVTQLTGHGEGIFSRAALKKLMDLVTPVLDSKQTVFLTIKAKAHETVDKKDVGAHAPLL